MVVGWIALRLHQPAKDSILPDNLLGSMPQTMGSLQCARGPTYLLLVSIFQEGEHGIDLLQLRLLVKMAPCFYSRRHFQPLCQDILQLERWAEWISRPSGNCSLEMGLRELWEACVNLTPCVTT